MSNPKRGATLFDISAPSPVDVLYKKLGSERLRIERQWVHYEGLFGSQEKRELLAECAPSLFQGLKETILSDTILSTVQMVDDETSHSERVDLSRLRDEVANDGRKSLAADLSDHLDQLRDLCPALRQKREEVVLNRNEHAHRGGEDYHEISEVPVKNIGEALKRTGSFLNDIASRYHGVKVAYRSYADQSRAETLIESLD